MVRSMTEGSPIKLILSFSIMVLLGDLFQQFYNIMDAVIVGRALGPEALAAVGATSSVQFLILGFGMGICMGFAIPIAQRFGAKDYSNMRRYIRHGWILMGILATVFTVACAAATTSILRLLSVESDIFQMTYSYLFIIFLGIPCTLLYNYIANILRAIGDSRTPFLFLVLSALLNIGLDLLFICVFHWGCAGAAFATILSQGVSGILSFLYMHGHYSILRTLPGERDWSFATARKLLSMGLPMGLQFSITAIGSIILQTAINGFGPGVMAGYSAAIKLNNLVITSFTTLGNGISNYTGQNLGAGKLPRIPQGFRAGIKMVWLLSLPIVILYFTCGRFLLMLFMNTPSQDAMHTGLMLLRIVSPFYFVKSAKLVSDGVLRGAGLMGPFMAGTFTDLILRVLLAVFLSGTQLGATGIWCAWPVGWTISAILSIFFYSRGPWRQQSKAQEGMPH